MKTKMAHWLMAVLACICMLFGVACDTTKSVESVTLDQTSINMYIEETVELVATVNPTDATNTDIVWSSSNADIVSVDTNGIVTALALGNATITVTTVDGSKTAACSVTVQEGLKIEQTSVELGVAEEQTLSCTLNGSATNNAELVWSSSAATIVSVEGGKLTALAVGSAVITVKTADERCAASVSVTVVKRVESVSLDRTEITMAKGEQETLVATVNPSDASNKQVVWSSSNNIVATVENGVVTARNCGEVTITATTVDGAKIAECTVTVYQPVTGISLSVPTATINVGETYQLTATVNPMDATNKNVVWSSDSDVATVDQMGLVTAVSKGTAVITATTEEGNKTISCTITVQQPVTGVELDKDSDYVSIGGTLTLTAMVLPEDANNKNVTWSSDDEEVATVVNGVVTGVAQGEARIIATTEEGGCTAECLVTVLDVTVPSYISVGQSVDKNAAFDYSIKEGNALTVTETQVKATAAGVATLTISAGSFSQDFVVKVIDFGNTTGKTFDLATDVSLWQYRNYSEDTDVTITYENNVADGRTTPYTFNALKYSRPQNTGEYRALTGNLMYLTPEIIALAKSVGYQYISFTVMIKDNPTGTHATNFAVYNVNADGSQMWVKGKSDPIFDQNIGLNWKRYSISLTSEKVFEGAGLGFGAYGKELYITKVEFTGADISEYASQFFTESTTAGKSMDIVSEELMGKMFTSVSNAATLTYGTGGDKETALGGNDYIKLSKGDYLSMEYFTYNQLRIEADWIQAAKKLGWKTIAIYVLPNTFGNAGTISYLKQGVDGKCYAAHNKDTGRWKGTISTSHVWVSIDISQFEAGESLILACSGAEVAISGVTLRTATASLTYFNYDENIG